MRTPLSKLVLERALPAGPAERFFLAGPPAASRTAVNKVQHDALLADIRRQARRARPRVAA